VKLKNNGIVVLYAWIAAIAHFGFGGVRLHAVEESLTDRQVREIKQQNEALQEQLRQQRALINSLAQKINQLQENASVRASESSDSIKGNEIDSTSKSSFGPSRLTLTAEGGIAFFNTGSEGKFPNSEFRVDEAKLFIDAPIWGEIYFFGELDLMTRDAEDLGTQLGELYVDIENVSKLWNRERMLNLRMGRMYIPFGEEYLSRYAIDNPLISHSLSDIWGVDEGIELYGRMGRFSYAGAVQNGGLSGVRDFNSDKSVAGRIGYDPTDWLHLSVSAMRTGDLTPPGDYWSELWFGNGWLVPLSYQNITKFHAELFEGDIELTLPHGKIKAFGGYVRYGDNETGANNKRDIFYYSIEFVHEITRKLYAAARFSQILADTGYPIAGNGDPTEFVYSLALTDELWRLSLGMGYRWSQNFITKAEYSFERGSLLTGQKREHEDLFGVEAAFKF
jgi:hypothetical protein